MLKAVIFQHQCLQLLILFVHFQHLGVFLIYQKDCSLKRMKIKLSQNLFDFFNHKFFIIVYNLKIITLVNMLFNSIKQFFINQYLVHYFNFQNETFNTIFESINSINAIFSLILIVLLNFKSLSITSSKIINKNKWRYLFEGSNANFWAVNFKSFQIYKVQCYLIIIVQLKNYPEAQSILLQHYHLYIQCIFVNLYLQFKV
ncbi:unnamed protein product [Paramecium sonneborni]|uniref:Transmembrane protein n=1 Tax=Paramecium sonneborni TaxID=65129 RepID=A0A8S1MWB7_9CILI|nr:unnamed protein product [Paramecium sonneborni]